MAFSIRDSKTERLARRVAKETGESVTRAVRRALEEHEHKLRRRRPVRVRLEKLEEILRRMDGLPTVDTRSEEEILGYDIQGIPRSW